MSIVHATVVKLLLAIFSSWLTQSFSWTCWTRWSLHPNSTGWLFIIVGQQVYW